MPRIDHRARTTALALAAAALLAVLFYPRLEARPDGRDIDLEGSIVSGSLAEGFRFCGVAGCHDDEVDSTFNDRATVELAGLPGTFQAGEILDLSIHIDGPPSARVYGFQLAALFDDQTQAGSFQSLTQGVITHPIQGVEVLLHSPMPLNSPDIQLRWTAPAMPAGDVTFRVAANAANNNNDPSRDHIAVREITVKAPEVEPPPVTEDSFFAQVGDGIAGSIRFRTGIILVNTGSGATAMLDFFDSQGQPLTIALGALGEGSSFEIPLATGEAFSAQTAGAEGLQVGYARLRAPAGVGGTAVFTRSDALTGVNLFETGVPASKPLSSFSLFADLVGTRNTGLALVNPNQTAASATLRLFDKSFQQQAPPVSLDLPAGNHRARFVDELFAGLDPSFTEGVLTVESDLPLAAVTLRQGADEPMLDFPDEVPLLAAFPVVPGQAAPLEGGAFAVTAKGGVTLHHKLDRAAAAVLYRFYRNERVVAVRTVDAADRLDFSETFLDLPGVGLTRITAQPILPDGSLGRIIEFHPSR